MPRGTRIAPRRPDDAHPGQRHRAQRRGVGRGPRPLLLLHGFTGDTSTWDALRSTAWPGHRCDHASTSSATVAPTRPQTLSATRWRTPSRDLVRRPRRARHRADGRCSATRWAVVVALHLAVDAAHGAVSALILESASPGIETQRSEERASTPTTTLADDIEQRRHRGASSTAGSRIPLFASQLACRPRCRRGSESVASAQSPLGLANSLRGMGAGRQDYLLPRLHELIRCRRCCSPARSTSATRRSRRAHSSQAARRDHAGAGHAAHLEQPDAFARRRAFLTWTQLRTTVRDPSPRVSTRVDSSDLRSNQT